MTIPPGCILVYATARIAGLVAVLPVPLARSVPLSWRIALVACLLLVVGPTLISNVDSRNLVQFMQQTVGEESGKIDDLSTRVSETELVSRWGWQGWSDLRWQSVACEFAMGVSLAAVPSLMLLAFRVGLDVVSRMVGLASMEFEVSGDSGLSTSLTGFVHLFAGCAFLLTNGHRKVVQGLLDTFLWLPGGQRQLSSDVTEMLRDMLSASFRFGCTAVLPVLACLLLATLAAGAISRAVPTLQQTAASATFGLATYTLAMWMMFGVIGWVISARMDGMLATVMRVWRP